MLPSSKDIITPGILDIGRDRVATILQTLRRGWDRACAQPEVRPGTQEVELNLHLANGMRKAVETRVNGQGPKMLVVLGTQTVSGPDVRAPDGLVDIAVYFPTIFETLHQHDPHAIIECKRVAGTDSGQCREYVREGIDRFASGKYGGQHAVGFMAGYLESGTADHAATGINRYLDRQLRSTERLGPAVAFHEDWVRSSRHPRPGGSEALDLHHAFLAFT